MLPPSLRTHTAGARALIAELRPVESRSHVPGWLAPLLALGAAGLAAAFITLHGHEFIRAVERALHAGWWAVGVGAACEAASLAGYVLLLHHVVSRGSPGLRPRDSYDIALGGTAATRLVPTAGVGGVAVAVWALRARGMRPRELTERLLAFVLLLYGVYMLALLVSGAAVALGLVQVSQGRALGFVGAGIGAGLGGGVVLMFAWPAPVRAALRRISRRSGRFAGRAERTIDRLPVLQDALRRTGHALRHPDAALLGAVASWGFDIAVLAAMLHAFDAPLPIEAVVLGYFLGTLFNLLPLPGSLSGGLAGAMIALGAPAAPAIAAVLAYRAIAVWLPAASGIASLASLRASAAEWRAQSGEPGAATRTPGRQFAV